MAGNENAAVETVENVIDNAKVDGRIEGFVEGLEAAQERVDAAQEDAARIADAALATEIGRRVATLETEVNSWLVGEESRVAALARMLEAQQQEIQMLRERLTSLEASPTPSVILAPATETETNSSILPPSAEVAETLSPTAMDPPAESVVVVPVVQPEGRKKRGIRVL